MIAIVVLALGAALWLPAANLSFALRLAWALNRLASGATGEDLPVRQTTVQRNMSGVLRKAIVYRPAGHPPDRALILAPGISELGCYHPRLMALCRYLADLGFLVLTPDIPEFREFEVSAGPIRQMVFWYRQIQTVEGGRRLEHVGMGGISFSASLALIATADAEVRNSADCFLGIGPYFDLQRCYRGWFTSGPVTVSEGYYPTRFYAKWIIMNAALGMLPSERDRQFLHEVLLDLLLQKSVPHEDSTLTAEGRRWYRLATMREDESDDELTRDIDAYLTPRLFRQLDPARAAAEIRCPVFLVHGAYDDLIPPEESIALRKHITHAPCSLLISPFLTHTHPLEKPLTLKQKVVALAAGLRFLYGFAQAAR